MASPYPQQGVPPEGPAAVPDSYFTESRKGEVNELKNLLRNFGTERDPKRKREIIKKVIAYMTLGIDVSRLFSEMILGELCKVPSRTGSNVYQHLAEGLR
jgi:AP-4 complex subunit beta-1